MMKRILALLLTVSIVLGFCGVSAEAAESKKISAPKITVKSTSDGNPKITWDAVEGADGYRVYRKTGTDKKYVKVTTTSKLSATDKKWSSDEGEEITYAVKAYYKDDTGKTKWSKYSSAKSWTVPKKATKAVSTPKPTPSPKPSPKPTPSPKPVSKSGSEVKVWIAVQSGKKYHVNPNCRGLSQNNGLEELTLSEAKRRDYTYCKICSKNVQ